ncbi:hypothetical protein D9M72_651840 [compost metagenome]
MSAGIDETVNLTHHLPHPEEHRVVPGRHLAHLFEGDLSDFFVVIAGQPIGAGHSDCVFERSIGAGKALRKR